MKRICFLVIVLLLSMISVYASDSVVTITDIDTWNHPVKLVLSDYGVNVTKVEFLSNKTYPVIYCNFPAYSALQEKETFEQMLVEVLKSNGYWSYKLVSDKYEVNVEGDINDKKYIKISYKNMDKYFKMFPNAENIKINLEQATKLMTNEFGESHETELIEEGNYKVSIINAIDGVIEYDNNYYYSVHTYESHYDHTATLGWALIDAIDGSIYYDNLDDTATLVNDSKKSIVLNSLNDGTVYKLLNSSLASYKYSYLWQYNKKTKELQKVDLNGLKIVANIKLSETFIKGDVISVDEPGIYSGESVSTNTVVVATKDKEQFNIYKSINESDNFKWYLDINSLKSVYKELTDVAYFKGEYTYELSINYGKIMIEFINDSSDGWIDLSNNK
ncbi:MAG TPA: hypothetical protein VEB00_05175 [Clostridia bacterium]|nr:hypothetical protein [Clostridia bacterium]